MSEQDRRSVSEDAQQFPSQVTDQITDQVMDQTTGQTPDQITDQTTDQAIVQAAEQEKGQVTGSMSDKTTDQIAIIFHADDYGITVQQSEHILSCGITNEGALNSLSIMVGSPAFDSCASLLSTHQDILNIGLHFNLTEGPALSIPQDIPLLVDERGFFKTSFATLLAQSFGLQKAVFVKQVACEAQAQIERFVKAFPFAKHALRIDSHQHIHLIPGVLQGLREGIKQSACTLEYLRIPTEPAIVFKQTGVAKSVKPINVIKRITLNTLYKLDQKHIAHIKKDYNPQIGCFCGVSLSGKMDYERVVPLLCAYHQYARDYGYSSVEFLFHPGGLDAKEACLDERLKGHVAFYLDEGRKIETLALRKLAGFHYGAASGVACGAASGVASDATNSTETDK